MAAPVVSVRLPPKPIGCRRSIAPLHILRYHLLEVDGSIDVSRSAMSEGDMIPLSLDVAALDNLVEAATALAKLTNFSPRPADSGYSKMDVVEDEGAAETFETPNKREIFPQRLMAILNDSSLSDIVSWLPHGRSFVIIRPDVFTERVLPMYLPPVDARSSTKYPSFTRKLNRW